MLDGSLMRNATRSPKARELVYRHRNVRCLIVSIRRINSSPLLRVLVDLVGTHDVDICMFAGKGVIWSSDHNESMQPYEYDFSATS